MKKQRFSNKGAALPVVMMVMLISFILASGVIALVNSQSKTETFYEKNMKALHAAETGIHQYLWYLNKESGAEVLTNGSETIYQTDDQRYVYTLEMLYDSNGKKVLKSTGWIYGDPSVKRVVEATLKKRSYTEWVYYSDNDGNDIYWSSSDRCYGPYRTNTTLNISGNPIFFYKVYYGKAIKVKTGWPIYKDPPPEFKEAEALPASNNELKQIAESKGTCFEGRTSILLKKNGDIVIWNPNMYGEDTTITLNTADVDIIYVNGTKSEGKFDKKGGNVFVSGTLSGRLTIASANDIYITNYNPTKEALSDAKSDSNGKYGISYANTTFGKNTTTGELAYPVGDDMLGLIPMRDCAILTYGWFDSANSVSSSLHDINVCAAILAGQGSFGNSHMLDMKRDEDKWWKPKSTTTYPDASWEEAPQIILWGCIIQKKRGAVGQFSGNRTTHGYSKDYAYDQRMMYETPPYFLEPDNSGWEVYEWSE